MEEKRAPTIEEVRKSLKDKKDKKDYLKSLIKDKSYEKIKSDLLKELAVLVKGEPIKSYNLIYDSLSEALEPIYFWILDFMQDSKPAGLGLKVWKGKEEFEASVSSGYFGEIGQRATLMQQKAMEYLGAINNVIKSILNLIYDLREFEIRIAPYDKLKDKKLEEKDKIGALFSLKGLWMDQVDSRKGRGSINLLGQDLQFATLRDAFFYVKESSGVTKELDLNERVKNILKRKLEEFEEWKLKSEDEIRKRYEIEKKYLRSQVKTLELYASWVKPYLIAAQKLRMRGSTPEGLRNANIVNSFSNMEIELSLMGKKEVNPGDVHESYSKIVLEKKYYSVVEINLKFRSVPSTVSGQGGRHYVHGGRTDIVFNAFALDNIELEALEALELHEDLELINTWVHGTLKDLEEDLQK
ncbi:hypothetical protein J4216_00975 [Candidatus Woesearchaeota archaeon]|nr:hypothetical protein [Candidatus Woesearchaeota archaeon]